MMLQSAKHLQEGEYGVSFSTLLNDGRGGMGMGAVLGPTNLNAFELVALMGGQKMEMIFDVKAKKNSGISINS